MLDISINGALSKTEDTLQIQLHIKVKKVEEPVKKQEFTNHDLALAIVTHLLSKLEGEQ